MTRGELIGDSPALEPEDALAESEYSAGFEDGWNQCHRRFEAVLKRFPIQCAMISSNLPLIPDSPNQILEPNGIK